MSIFGFPGRKYVYPTLMLVGLFFLLLRYAFGGEPDQKPVLPDRVRETSEPRRDPFVYDENEFINASELFNDSIKARLDPITQARVDRQEDRVRSLTNDWRNSTRGYAALDNRRLEASSLERAWDRRYNEERRQLEDERSRELHHYRESRHLLQNRMSGFNRDASEYASLENQLSDLDRRHAESERDFEKRFRSIDTNYSINRW